MTTRPFDVQATATILLHLWNENVPLTLDVIASARDSLRARGKMTPEAEEQIAQLFVYLESRL